MTEIIRKVGERSQAAVKVGHDNCNWFQTSTGTRQGDRLSRNIFIIYLERMMDGIHGNGSGISIQGERLNNLRFADDIHMIEESSERLADSVKLLDAARKKACEKINVEKTKTMIFGKKTTDTTIEVNGEKIANVRVCLSR